MTPGRAAALALLVAVAVLSIAAAREASIGRDEALAADAAAAASDWPGAIAHARAAAEAIAPGSPWPDRALRRLAAIGHDAEARGDEATALLAYGAMRTAALTTAAPGGGRARWRDQAEAALARVAAASADTAGARVVSQATLAALRDEPRPGGSLVLSLASAATLAGLAGLAFGARDRRARLAAAIAAAGFVAYAAALLAS